MDFRCLGRVIRSLAFLAAAGGASAQAPRDPLPPMGLLSPDRTRLLLMERSLPSTAETASAPAEIQLAGVRLDPRNNAATGATTFSALIVQPLGQGETRRLIVPWQARISSAAWSPDGNRVALTLLEAGGTSLWVANPASGEIRIIAGPILNGAGGAPCQWLPSNAALLCRRIPAGRMRPQSNLPDDAAFDYYLASQLVVIPVSGEMAVVGKEGVYRSVSVSPDGRFIAVAVVKRPDVRSTGLERLPARFEVWDLTTGSVVRVIHDGAGGEGAGGGAEAPGPRAVEWRGDRPASLAWLETGDAAGKGAQDRLVELEAPFGGTPRVLASLPFRAGGVVWARTDLVLIQEAAGGGAKVRSWAVNPERGVAPRLLIERPAGQTGQAAEFLTRSGQGGKEILLTSRDQRYAFLRGTEFTPAANRPFLDRIDLMSGKALRLWSSTAPYYEEAVGYLDTSPGRVIVRRESRSDPSDFVVRDLRKRGAP